MVDCYRVADFRVETGDRTLRVAVQTSTLGARKTNVRAVLSMVATKVEDPFSQEVPWPTHGAVFTLRGAHGVEVQTLLRAHQAPAVTVMTEADLSVALDFYSHRPAGTAGWKRTKTGAQIYRAKYGQPKSEPAADQLVQAGVAYVKKHPVLRRASYIAALPSSTAAGPARRNTLPMKLMGALEQAFGMQDARLARVTTRDTKQKNLPVDADRTSHQRGTMAVHEPGPGSVLIVDDVLEYGDSMNEAVRAVRTAGLNEVFTLCLAKNVKGTTRYSFEAE